MMPFLKETAEEIWRRHGKIFHELAIVFPNKRQAGYFQDYLVREATPPFFLPEMLTIEELVARSSHRAIADPVTQTVYLCRAFEKLAKQHEDIHYSGMEAFFPIAETIVNDFREIDSYFLDINLVCDNLRELEMIDSRFDVLTEEQKDFLRGFWSGLPDRGEVQKRFLELWERLPEVYREFHGMLEAQGLTTIGMCYRKIALNEADHPEFIRDWQHLAFVGFNAFNRAEETFLKRWQEEGRISFWMDVDRRYLDDPLQESGFFLRRNLHQLGFKNEWPPRDYSVHNKPSIHLVAAQGNLGQAQTVEKWWEEEGSKVAKPAIILADESLLMPVLQSLPEGLPELNITMGLPLAGGQVDSLAQLFLEIHLHPATDHGKRPYHLVKKWLESPFCDLSPSDIARNHEKLKKEYLLHVPFLMLQKWSTLTQLMFMPLKTAAESFDRLQELLESGMKIKRLQQDEMATASITAGWQLMEQLKTLFRDLQLPDDLHLLSFITKRQFAGISIPIQANKNSGIQLMGLLESRGLDFDAILLLGAHEGSLPRIRAPKSFLPVNIRRAFGLPVPEHQDAIFAYVFYRLLHRSQSLRAVFNALITDNSNGEISRFLQQLEFETDWAFTRENLGMDIRSHDPKNLIVRKDEAIMRKMFASIKNISPTAIRSYVHCRMQFYFRYVAGLKPVETLEEGVQASSVGKVVHLLMEMLYKEALSDGGAVNIEIIDNMRKRVPHLIDLAFQQTWYEKPLEHPMEYSGELLVVKAVVEKLVKMLLDIDAKYAPFQVISLEQKFEVTFRAFKQKINLSGFVDRVDLKDGVYRMVDYKTGGDKPAFMGGLQGLLEPHGDKQNGSALQTLIYAWIFRENNPAYQSFEPALLGVRNLQTRDASMQLKDNMNNAVVSAENIHDYLDELEELLAGIFAEIFSENIPFTQVDDWNKCTYCDYIGICQRK